MKTSERRKPASFDLDDPQVRLSEKIVAPEIAMETNNDDAPAKKPRAGKSRSSHKNTGTKGSDVPVKTTVDPAIPATTARIGARLSRWGSLLFSSVAALSALAIGLAATRLIENLFARADWIGWVAFGLAGLAALALLAIIIREFAALARLRQFGRIRDEAVHAGRDGSERAARMVIKKLKKLYQSRPDCSWQLARLREAEPGIFDAADLMKIAERTLMKDLDGLAKAEIALTAKRVSVVTAVSPAALIDIGFVLVANLSMIRKLATIYGGRPGIFGMLKLSRMVLAHLTVTGGIALGDSLLQQIFGHGIAARLSARLGEGVLNGLFTARIGLAALEVCRPLPFTYLPAPAIKDLMSEVVRPGV